LESVIPRRKNITPVDVQMQAGGNDCSLYAVAYIVDIIFGRDPSMIVYEQSLMRYHMVDWLHAERFTPFVSQVKRVNVVIE
jgi:hypothetical protein